MPPRLGSLFGDCRPSFCCKFGGSGRATFSSPQPSQRDGSGVLRLLGLGRFCIRHNGVQNVPGQLLGVFLFA